MTTKILTHLRDVQMLMNAGQLLPAGRSLTAATPCNDCIDNSGLREAFDLARASTHKDTE